MPRVEQRAGLGVEAAAVVVEPAGDGVDGLATSDDGAGHEIRVAAEVLGAAVEHGRRSRAPGGGNSKGLAKVLSMIAVEALPFAKAATARRSATSTSGLVMVST